MSENTVPDVTTIPSKSVFNKTNAIRVGVAALAAAAVAVAVVVKMKTGADPIEAVVELVPEA